VTSSSPPTGPNLLRPRGVGAGYCPGDERRRGWRRRQTTPRADGTQRSVNERRVDAAMCVYRAEHIYEHLLHLLPLRWPERMILGHPETYLEVLIALAIRRIVLHNEAATISVLDPADRSGRCRNHSLIGPGRVRLSSSFCPLTRAPHFVQFGKRRPVLAPDQRVAMVDTRSSRCCASNRSGESMCRLTWSSSGTISTGMRWHASPEFRRGDPRAAVRQLVGCRDTLLVACRPATRNA
jgi:hypothetical protein